MNGYDLPQGYRYQPEPFEYTALAVAHRFLKHIENYNLNVPKQVWGVATTDGDEDDVKDYIFVGDKGWVTPSKYVRDKHWDTYVVGNV